MTQESEILYRSNLESVYVFLEQKYQDQRHMMLVKDVAEYTGLCFQTVKKKFFRKGGRMITAENFARALARLEGERG